jgi:MYXO-CTERM domain-containing protein
VCQDCGKIDGSQNPGPTLALPCGGSVDNNDGVLQCIGVPTDAGSPSDAGGTRDATSGADDGGQGAGVEGGSREDAGGGADAATRNDAGASDEGGVVAGFDASLSGDGSPTTGNDAVSFGTSGGCACESAPGQRESTPTAFGASVLLAFLQFRRRRNERSRTML